MSWFEYNCSCSIAVARAERCLTAVWIIDAHIVTFIRMASHRSNAMEHTNTFATEEPLELKGYVGSIKDNDRTTRDIRLTYDYEGETRTYVPEHGAAELFGWIDGVVTSDTRTRSDFILTYVSETDE